MQSSRNSSFLQTGQQGQTPTSGWDSICRVPSNHRQAELKVIEYVKSGEFEIDEMGQIWRLKRRGGQKKGGVISRNITRKRAESKGRDYLQVHSMKNGIRTSAAAHRLVWLFFNGPIKPGMTINHKNGIKGDNRPENLEVMTYSENQSHAHKMGLINQWGDKNPAHKLTNSQVEEIRKLYAGLGYTQQQLANKYEVCFQHISSIVRGKVRRKEAGKIGDYTHLRQRNLKRDPKTGRMTGNVGRTLDGIEWNELPKETV
jgi:DNA-binding XRE family transcriptional regulator